MMNPIATYGLNPISVGLASGIDWTQLVDALITIERRPVTILENRLALLQQRLMAWQAIQSKLNELKSLIATMDEEEELLLKSGTSSNEEIATVEVTSSAEPGTHSLEVTQLAQAHEIKSRGWADTDTTTIGGTGFTIYLGDDAVCTITGTSAMTLADLVTEINNAQDKVRAFIFDDGTPVNPYHLVLISKLTGQENVIHLDENTNLTFGDADPDGPWDNYVEAAETGDTESWEGTSVPGSNQGTNFTGTKEKTFKFTIVSINGNTAWDTTGTVGTDTIVIRWEDGECNTGTITLNNTYDGSLVNVFEGVQTSLTTGGTVHVGDYYFIDTHIYEIQEAKDSKITLDGIALMSSGNTISDVLPGLTINLLKADPSETVTITIENDKEGVKEKIREFIDKYNEVILTIRNYDYYNPDTGVAGPLFGDMTSHDVLFRLQDLIISKIAPLPAGDDYESLADIGLDLELSGTISIDESELDEKLDEDFENVIRLFTESASWTNTNIRYAMRTRATPEGYYEVNAGFDASGNLTGATVNYYDADHNLVATYSGTQLDYSDNFIIGKADTLIEGIYIYTKDPDGDGIETGEVRLSLGVAAKIYNQIEYWNDPVDPGPIVAAINALNDQIEDYNEQIQEWDERLEKLRQYYLRRFATMESFLQEWLNQASSLSSFLGTW